MFGRCRLMAATWRALDGDGPRTSRYSWSIACRHPLPDRQVEQHERQPRGWTRRVEQHRHAIRSLFTLVRSYHIPARLRVYFTARQTS
jgi:hypothetical protein